MTRWKSTILALLLAIAGVGAMLRQMRQDGAASRQVEASGRVLSASQLPVDELTRITVSRAGMPPLVFERNGAGGAPGASDWNQVRPFMWPMDPFSIRQIAIAARELEAADSIDPATLGQTASGGSGGAGQTLATLSLDPPAAEVTYEWPKGKTVVQLGRQSVAGRAYVRVAGDPRIHVVGQRLHERILGMDPKEWRDRTVFRNIGVESERIEWTQGQAKMALARDRRTWKMLEPAATRLDAAGRDAYFDALGRAQAAGFIADQPSADDLSKFGLAEPVATLTVTGTGSSIQRLLVGSPVGGGAVDRFAMIEGRPAVVKLSGPVIAALFRQPENLAAATGSGVISADVKSIVIRNALPAEQGGGELKLERKLDKWSAPDHGSGGAGAPVDAALVQELLDQLTTVKAPSVEFKPYPRDLEIAAVTLYGFDGKALDTVRIAQEKDAADGPSAATPGKIALENGDNVLRVFPAGVKLKLTAKDFGLQ